MKNYRKRQGHCNGRRYLIEGFSENRQLICAKPLDGGEILAIHKIPVRPEQRKIMGFQLERVHPVRLSFFTSIHKGQGRTIEEHCGVYIKDPADIFSRNAERRRFPRPRPRAPHRLQRPIH